MAASSITRLAQADFTFQGYWNKLDSEYRRELCELELDTPLSWAGLLTCEPEEQRDRLEEILTKLGLLSVSVDIATQRVDRGLELYRAAQAPATGWAKAMAGQSELQVAIDRAHAKRCREEAEVHRDFSKLAAAQSAFTLPAIWRGKRYRRAEEKGDAKAQQEAEDKERSRWGKRLVQLLVEAQLPFGREVAARGLAHDSREAFRCLRGMRPNTLRKRVQDWEPVRRWLLAETGTPFPASPAPLLSYLEARRAEGAARTAFDSALSALRFLEEAGEVQEGLLLHKHPALKNTAKEGAAEKAKSDEASGEKGKGQAPPLPLALLAALELEVNNTDAKLYQRAYAWYRLLRHWASLRFDDTAGLAPRTLQRRTRGLFGLLRRTKTSGPGKKMSVLPIWVSQDAWVARPWLDTGFRLWTEGALNYDRDYFLCLPAESLEDTCRLRARYSDAVGFSRALLANLKVPGEEQQLLLPSSVPFWTEHSDRAGVDSWLAALGVSADLRRFVGRWAVHGSEDVYVRTAVRVTENLQRLAAVHARLAYKYGPDFFGEEHLAEQLRAFLLAQGVPDQDAQTQLDTLQVSNYNLNTEVVAKISESGGFEEIAEDTELISEPAAALPVEDGAESDGTVDGIDQVQDISAEDAVSELEAAVKGREADAPEAPCMGFIVSLSRSGKPLRLHFAGGCHRLPGTHYLRWRDCGQTMPPAEQVQARCKDCFPALEQEERLEEQNESGNDSSSSSSSSAPGLE